MIFRITWATVAFDQMEMLVFTYPEMRAGFADALQQLTGWLESDPFGCGESREEDRRIVFADPLVVDYRVIVTADRVVILGVRLQAGLD